MEKCPQFVQLDLFSLLPGSAGGRAVRDRYGTAHFRAMAQKAKERCAEEKQASALKGAQTRLRRPYSTPRTRVSLQLDEEVTERIIPYWPHTASRRRIRPVWVKIELGRRTIPGVIPYFQNLPLRERQISYSTRRQEFHQTSMFNFADETAKTMIVRPYVRMG